MGATNKIDIKSKAGNITLTSLAQNINLSTPIMGITLDATKGVDINGKGGVNIKSILGKVTIDGKAGLSMSTLANAQLEAKIKADIKAQMITMKANVQAEITAQW